MAFLLHALEALREWYRDCGSDLVVRNGAPEDVIPTLVAEYDATGVTWNHDYSGLAQRRDERVATSLDEIDVGYNMYHDAIHHEPGTIRTNDGEPYSVFSYFWKKWMDREKQEPVPVPETEDLVDRDADSPNDTNPLPSLDDLGFDEPTAEIPNAGQRQRVIDSIRFAMVLSIDTKKTVVIPIVTISHGSRRI